MKAFIIEVIEDARDKQQALKSAPIQIVTKGILSENDGTPALQRALKWYRENIKNGRVYNTVKGKILIDEQSIRSTMAHKYGPEKLDAITSLFTGFDNAVYLTDMEDYDDHSLVYSYFVYPIQYDGELGYCLCRTRLKSDIGAKHRLYIHEVFSDKYIKNFTYQAAADEGHRVRGKVLYSNLLKQVIDYKDSNTQTKSNEEQ